jgi:adenosine deaminase
MAESTRTDLLYHVSINSVMDTEAIIKALPKLEQHVHIVGSTKPETLLWILEDTGADSDLETIEDVQNFFQFSDFDHFISVYGAVNDSITDEKYYEKITYEMLQSDAECNVKHVEAIFSAYDHVRRGLDYGKMVDNINKGIRKAKRDFDISCTIRIDLVRNYGPSLGMTVLDLIEEKGNNVVAVDIGGTEAGYPPAPYKEVYERAKTMGLHLCAHAGEAAGLESVWDAINHLNVDRLGHGTIARNDASLMKAISERGIGIETCPVSNLRTGAISSVNEHPIRTFIKNGIKVSVNSDDPPMFNTDMNYEYITIHKELGFTVQELFKISLDSIETSFLLPEEKEQMKKRFLADYQKLTN